MNEEKEILEGDDWQSQYVEETPEEIAEIEHAARHLRNIQDKRKPRMVWKQSGLVLSQMLLFVSEFVFFVLLWWGFFSFVFPIKTFGVINSLYLTFAQFCVRRWVRN